MEKIANSRPVLYRRGANGVQVWSINISPDGESYTVVHGKLHGKLQETRSRDCVATNVGRSNERDIKAQVIAQVEARYKKQMEAGFVKSLSDLPTEKPFSPMLAHPYDEAMVRRHWNKQFSELVVQPKLDGIRLLVSSERKALSRSGKPIVAVPHITVPLLRFLQENYPSVTLDGELYSHEYKANFPMIISLVRKTRLSKDQLEESKCISYFVYDCFDSKEPGLSFKQRFKLLKQIVGEFGNKYLVLVDTYFITGNSAFKNAEEAIANFVQDGYEGGMLRDPNSPYEFKRSNSLLKHKQFTDEEFKLLKILEGLGNKSGQAAKGLLETADGIKFEASICGPRDYLVKVLENPKPFLGKFVTVKFQGKLPTGKPRFAVITKLSKDI
jgi:DNA ligase-1